MKFEYALLKEVHRQWEWGWIFGNDDQTVHRKPLIDILNTLGADGWQLVCKEKVGEYREYLMMRQTTIGV